MPRKPATPCSYPGCPEIIHGRYCDQHVKHAESATIAGMSATLRSTAGTDGSGDRFAPATLPSTPCANNVRRRAAHPDTGSPPHPPTRTRWHP